MRRRVIDPAFWNDSKVISMSLEARLLYIGLWNYADDEGYFLDDVQAIKRTLFPDQTFYIEEMFSQCSRFLEMFFYKDEEHYAWRIHNFLDWQTINRPTPSKIKPLCKVIPHSVSPHGVLTPKLNKDKLSEVKSETIRIVSPQRREEASRSAVWPTESLWLKEFLETEARNLVPAPNGTLIDPRWWDAVSETCGGLSLPFLRTEFSRISAWLTENPRRSPAQPRGWKRFIRTWLERAHERERRIPNANPRRFVGARR